MLDNNTIKKIEDYVCSKPRSTQEIATHIGRNWRTADRYVEEISNNYGTLATRTFREGTRGALKIVYYAGVEKISSTAAQQKLEQEINICRRKEDFSAFDIFQHVPDGHKAIIVKTREEESTEEFGRLLLQARKQVLFFSGNMSFINLTDQKKDLFKVFEQLAKNNITMKVLCRVDLVGRENIERALSINLREGKDLIEIRHDTHPLRGVIIDNQLVRLKEVKEPTGKIYELNKRAFIFYNIQDKQWADWLTKVFWKKFLNSIDARKRLEHLNRIRV